MSSAHNAPLHHGPDHNAAHQNAAHRTTAHHNGKRGNPARDDAAAPHAATATTAPATGRRRALASVGALALATGACVAFAGGAAANASTPAAASAAAAAAVSPQLSKTVAPGGNFNLSVWELQLPTGSAGDPTTIPSSQLQGAKGFQDSYFYTNTSDGGMSFWDPENGVTTPNSSYPRSELRETTTSGQEANWFPAGTTNTLSASVKVTQVPNHVCVGQIHLGSGGSTKPLLELFYYSNGQIKIGIEQTPAGGNEILYTVGTVSLGTEWSYKIGLANSTISLSINGGKATTWQMSSTFAGYGMYFKAGDYDQTAGSSSTVGAKVEFYALTVSHG